MTCGIGTYRWCLAVVLFCGLLACKRQDSEVTSVTTGVLPANSQQATQLLHEPVVLQRLELASEALPIWRRYAAQRPSLLLLSGDPMLTPVPEALREEVSTLLKTGSDESLVARSRTWGADPLLLPTMTIDAALRAGWFSQLVWALPLPDPRADLKAEVFLRQMHEGGFLAKGEGVGFGMTENRLRGILRRAPFTAAAITNLPKMPGPAIVHIDMSYWQMLYKNEKITPLIRLVRETLTQLQKNQIPVLAVTVSLGNRDQRIALELRGAARLVEDFCAHPTMLDAPLAEEWQVLSDLLALAENATLTEPVPVRLAERALKNEWGNYGLYRIIMVRNSDGVAAMNHLSRAVGQDRIYALEYLHLAMRAVDTGKVEEAFGLLELAQEAFPDDLRIKLLRGQLSASQGDRRRFDAVVKDLHSQPWSPIYFPDMTGYLKNLERTLSR